MQFIPRGPEVPDSLLQAHEEGRVVFFCGAGISYPAGLPGFRGLVEKVYELAGTGFTDIEREAFEGEQYDATLDLLERRFPGQRLAVRRYLTQALNPKLRRKGATDTHASLLTLASDREDALRLVTTNFDRIFHTAAKRLGSKFQTYAAPMLPIPKKSRWNGLVYLHGLLPPRQDDDALNRLVITSGDFGLAYLTERWAARFVSELFRNYVVCFVGYSINDPVLRYMMDALAADRMLGEVTPQAWAFADCPPGEEKSKEIEWAAKGVKPILYEVPLGSHDHSALHETLHAWADTYRNGVLGKERIVVSHAFAGPSASTQEDDFIGRVLWALSDKSALPAKRFAELNPVPPLEWLLNCFSDDRFQHADLLRFQIPPHAEVDRNLRFSLISRPTPYDRAPRMVLALGGTVDSQWDEVMHQMARWLVRHLDDPRLFLWVAQRGGRLHENMRRLLESQLELYALLARAGNTSQLAIIRSNSPRAIPGPTMRKLWLLLLGGQVKSLWWDTNIYGWVARLKTEGLTVSLRLELRKLISPRLVIRQPFQAERVSNVEDGPKSIRHLVDWDLVLASDHLRSALSGLDDIRWQSAKSQLIEDFQLSLRDALDLFRELGEADDLRDRSFVDMPSIAPHGQDQGVRDWVFLVELLRDAWLALLTTDRAGATRIAESWFEIPYPSFKRLALFAASKADCIPPVMWVDWLLRDSAWWLWSIGTKREVSRLLVLQGAKLSSTSQLRLEDAIMEGPPRHMFIEDLEPTRWRQLVERSIWLRLAKLQASGIKLGPTAKDRFTKISDANPTWKLAEDESDEFSFWVSDMNDSAFQEHREIAPRKRNELVKWLRSTKPPSGLEALYGDTWPEVCRSRFFHSLYALCDLANEGIWPAERWSVALQVWSDEATAVHSWRFAAPLVATMPDSVLEEIVSSVARWLDRVSKLTNQHEAVALDLCRRILNMSLDSDTGIRRNGEPIDEPLTEAINHPIGHVTQTLLNLWFKREPSDRETLPTDIEPLFTKLCDVNSIAFRHGRVLLATQLIAIFRVDSCWAEKHFLPYFSWDSPREASAVWQGFLWSPRLYHPLLIAIKSQLLHSVNHFDALGERRQQFAAFLTYLALEPIAGYGVEELRSAFGLLPVEGLEYSARALLQSLDGGEDQREELWKNRIQPFWQHIWPKDRSLETPRLAEILARLIIAARSEFSAALSLLYDWLRPLDHPQHILQLLLESNLCSEFPTDALRLLDAVIIDQPWIDRELNQCLDSIEGASRNVVQDPRFRRLRDFARS